MMSKIPSLNGLRATSILMVVAGHLYSNGFFPSARWLRLVSMVAFNGQLAVNIFFVISGFLITTLLKKERERLQAINLPSFYLRRIIRIFPAYYCYLTVLAIAALAGYFSIDAISWISAVSFTKQFFRDGPYEIGHLWSLSVEEIFYLAWPFVFCLNTRSVKVITWILIAIISISRFFQFSYPNPYFSNTVFSTGDALLVGCTFAMNYERIARLILSFRRSTYVLAACLILCILINNFLFHLLDASPHSHLLLVLQSISYMLIGNIGLVTNIIIALMIVASINCKNTWYKVLNSKFLDHLGKLSYSIYLWQQPFIADRAFLHDIPVVFILLGIYGVATLSYRFIEQPFLALKPKVQLAS